MTRNNENRKRKKRRNQKRKDMDRKTKGYRKKNGKNEIKNEIRKQMQDLKHFTERHHLTRNPISGRPTGSMIIWENMSMDRKKRKEERRSCCIIT